MRRWWSRRLLTAVLVVVALGAGSACLFGPVARSVASAEASRRHLSLRVGAVRADWCGVILADLAVRPHGVEGFEARIDRACIALGWTLRVKSVDVTGVAVELQGARERLTEDLRTWRQGRGAPAGSAGSSHAPRVTVSGLRFRWLDGASPEPRAEGRDIDVSLGSDGARANIPFATARVGRWSATFAGASVDTSPDAVVRRIRAASLLVRYALGTDHDDPAASDAAPASRSLLPSLPDLRVLDARIRSAASSVSGRLAPGASVGVDALTWLIADPNERVSLTLGPGPLSVSREASALEIRFSTDPSSASTPLAVQLVLPTDAGDASLALDGGPISLARLGIREGAAGLVDVAKATATGRGRIVLAGDGSSLTFDGDGGVHGLSIHNARLATDVVRGLDFDLRAQGILTSRGELRVDDFDAALGSIRVSAGAVLEQDASHVAGTVRVEVPRSECQALLDSVPTALLPSLHGTRMEGTFEGRGRVEFDTRSLQDLKLDYEISDHCRIAVPVPALAPERFERPFAYRIHLPDGSTAEETTGPGSDNWTPLGLVSPYMQVAVLTTEDGAFPHHHGFNRAAIRSSIIANLEGGRFLRGASTITMQLAKNLFLSREKTVSRKLEEVVLTEYLEQTFSKAQLMELYLNVIEFGPSVYGITAAAEHYFGRPPAELNLGECLFLASILPAPVRLGAMREAGTVPDHWMNLLHRLMETAHKLGRITDAELAEAAAQPVVFWNGTDRPAPRAPVRSQRPADNAGGEAPTDSVPEGADEGP